MKLSRRNFLLGAGGAAISVVTPGRERWASLLRSSGSSVVEPKMFIERSNEVWNFGGSVMEAIMSEDGKGRDVLEAVALADERAKKVREWAGRLIARGTPPARSAVEQFVERNWPFISAMEKEYLKTQIGDHNGQVV